VKKTIIFDFDGTLADSFLVAREIIKKFSTEFGYKNPTDEDIALLRSEHPNEIIKKIGLSPLKIPFLFLKVRSEMHKQILDIKPIPGIKKVLKELLSQDYLLGIVTSNNEKNVHAFLQKNDIDFFDFIQTESSLFGKAQMLTKVLKKHGISPQDAVYVGDEIRDIEAAHKVGMKIISVSWGFNDKKGLAKFHPDALIDKPTALISSIKKIST
jgi:phosphoglycolate phosphatase